MTATSRRYPTLASLAARLGCSRAHITGKARTACGGQLPPWWPKRGDSWDHVIPRLHELGVFTDDDVRTLRGDDDEDRHPAPLSLMDQKRQIEIRRQLREEAIEQGRLIERDEALRVVQALGADVRRWRQRLQGLPEQLPMATDAQRQWAREWLQVLQRQLDDDLAATVDRLRC